MGAAVLLRVPRAAPCTALPTPLKACHDPRAGRSLDACAVALRRARWWRAGTKRGPASTMSTRTGSGLRASCSPLGRAGEVAEGSRRALHALWSVRCGPCAVGSTGTRAACKGRRACHCRCLAAAWPQTAAARFLRACLGRGGRRLLLGPAAALDASDPADFQVLHLPAVISVLTTLLTTRLPSSRPSFPLCHAACMHTACWMRGTAGTSVWTRQWSWGCAPSTTLPSATQPREAPCRVRHHVGGGAGRGGLPVRAAPRACRLRGSGQGSRAAAAQPRCSLPQHGPLTASVLSCGYCTCQDTLPSSVRPVSNPPLPSDHPPTMPQPQCPNPALPSLARSLPRHPAGLDQGAGRGRGRAALQVLSRPAEAPLQQRRPAGHVTGAGAWQAALLRCGHCMHAIAAVPCKTILGRASMRV